MYYRRIDTVYDKKSPLTGNVHNNRIFPTRNNSNVSTFLRLVVESYSVVVDTTVAVGRYDIDPSQGPHTIGIGGVEFQDLGLFPDVRCIKTEYQQLPPKRPCYLTANGARAAHTRRAQSDGVAQGPRTPRRFRRLRWFIGGGRKNIVKVPIDSPLWQPLRHAVFRYAIRIGLTDDAGLTPSRNGLSRAFHPRNAAVKGLLNPAAFGRRATEGGGRIGFERRPTTKRRSAL
ncbi:hypothetical protein EVAR_39710_1 [Eumeta japonica]|uniref:Uncharacterized protein n=1 Tax=Eumeta variegata TaxID=151549 RepID=A0A4C1W5P2_EUMVA|nr:hypothetical protein EVAR_39710_1 [Eumeta japonica]